MVGSVASLVSLANFCKKGTVTNGGEHAEVADEWQRKCVELNPFREMICSYVIKCTDVNCSSSSHAWLPCCPTLPVCACREHMTDVTNKRYREGVVWEQRRWEWARDRSEKEQAASLGREKKQYSGQEGRQPEHKALKSKAMNWYGIFLSSILHLKNSFNPKIQVSNQEFYLGWKKLEFFSTF